MKNRLNKHFSFSIPEAVVRTSLRGMPGVILTNGIYNIARDEIRADKLFEETIQESDAYEAHIMRCLSAYIAGRTGGDAVDEDALSKELAGFLVDDIETHSVRYAKYIGEFILKHENDREIQEGLDRIREGSILYMGLSYSIAETGSLTKPLTLYLGTEILFSLVGYNGKVFRQFADDFMAQVRVANAKGVKMITLRYFSETKKEIDEFFGTAAEIVEGRRSALLIKPAMKAITDGCRTEADVDIRRSDFYHRLEYSFGIKEDPCSNYYDEECFSCNLESLDYCDDEEDGCRKREMAVKLISHIHKLRRGNCFHGDLEAGHLLVTNTRVTLLASKRLADNLRVERGLDAVCNFAVSLDRMTSLLWYKLGNGFAKAHYPSGVRAVLKARIVLSAEVARGADKEYDKIKREYAEGRMSDSQVAARIITLRNKPVLPEELSSESLDEIMNFTPEYLRRYEEEVKGNREALKEKEALLDDLRADRERRLSEKDEIIAAQAARIKASNENNMRILDELAGYRRQEAEVLRRKGRRRNVLRFIASILWKLSVIAALTGLAIYLENTCQSKIPVYALGGVNMVGVICTVRSVLTKDIDKYLRNNQK